jgi:hypothetical protein
MWPARQWQCRLMARPGWPLWAVPSCRCCTAYKPAPADNVCPKHRHSAHPGRSSPSPLHFPTGCHSPFLQHMQVPSSCHRVSPWCSHRLPHLQWAVPPPPTHPSPPCTGRRSLEPTNAELATNWTLSAIADNTPRWATIPNRTRPSCGKLGKPPRRRWCELALEQQCQAPWPRIVLHCLLAPCCAQQPFWQRPNPQSLAQPLPGARGPKQA